MARNEKFKMFSRSWGEQLKKPRGTFEFCVQPEVLGITSREELIIFKVESEDGKTDVELVKDKNDRLHYNYQSNTYGSRNCSLSLGGFDEDEQVIGRITWEESRVQLAVVSMANGKATEKRTASSGYTSSQGVNLLSASNVESDVKFENVRLSP